MSTALRRTAIAGAIVAVVFGAGPFAPRALAHEVRPAYLDLREERPGEWSALWKTPMRGELRLALAPKLSGRIEALTPVATREAGGAAIQTWRFRALEPLRGQTLEIDGLAGTMTDALVRIEFADGSSFVRRLTPQEPRVEIPVRQGVFAAALVYLRLGVEHILLGVDHLLFVLGLLLIVRGRSMLLKTVTAFTVAHSLTLAAATLGYARAPLPPLNAAIALSILFLGPEIVRTWRSETSLTIRRPWVVAFAFGLLHGFGFASGLDATGLPRGEIPIALVLFNAGVELGQLAFVGLALALAHAFRVLEMRWPVLVERAPGYAVGVCGAFWTIDRTVAMVVGR